MPLPHPPAHSSRQLEGNPNSSPPPNLVFSEPDCVRLDGPLWKRLDSVVRGSADLHKLLANLRSSVTHCKANNTQKAYLRWLKKFQSFRHLHKLMGADLVDDAAMLFLQSLSNQGLGASSVSQAAAALSWEAKASDRSDPARQKAAQAIVLLAKRRAPPVKHKDPALILHLFHLQEWHRKKGTFMSERTFPLSLMLFGSCSRISDLIDFPRDSLTFLPNCVKIRLGKTKTDQLKRNEPKFAPKSSTTLPCPYTVIQTWMARPDVLKGSSDPLFPRAARGCESVLDGCFNDNLKSAFIGSSLKPLTSHAFRVGFSTAAANASVPMKNLQLAGLWKSQASLDFYVKLNIDQRLLPAKMIGF